ncbi:SsgA family sporulation/cell division regulator [Kitasatospora sp. NPDC002227]|uniref:SsgA family sporulation/cell division regulator n=1 Tax=Kitasatospora sp. NPDC002227 TaxID=3154773 RepID=UPI0033337035
MRFHELPEDFEGHHPATEEGLRAALTMELETAAGRCHQLPTELDYHPADPFVLRFTFHLPDETPVVWTVARELLLAGLTAPAGEGDVRVRPHPAAPGLVQLQLRSPTGAAALGADAGALREVLLRTELLVPLGAELDPAELDAELARLLGETAQEN